MKKTVLTFGLISGAVAAVMMLITLPSAHKIGNSSALVLGYTTIVLSALFIFFGVRSYRENVSGGRLTFGRGVAVGLLIAVISSLCYVATWEIIYFKFMPDFADKYAAQMIERAKASGATQQQIDQKTREAAQFKEAYKNPVYNVAMTFLEPFPVGLAVTLLSAAILRKRSARPAGQAA